jgi:hypothetical protein
MDQPLQKRNACTEAHIHPENQALRKVSVSKRLLLPDAITELAKRAKLVREQKATRAPAHPRDAL